MAERLNYGSIERVPARIAFLSHLRSSALREAIGYEHCFDAPFTALAAASPDAFSCAPEVSSAVHTSRQRPSAALLEAARTAAVRELSLYRRPALFVCRQVIEKIPEDLRAAQIRAYMQDTNHPARRLVEEDVPRELRGRNTAVYGFDGYVRAYQEVPDWEWTSTAPGVPHVSPRSGHEMMFRALDTTGRICDAMQSVSETALSAAESQQAYEAMLTELNVPSLIPLSSRS